MTNDEKILFILEGMQGDIKGLKDDVSGLKQDVAVLKDDVSGLKQDVAELKNGQKRLEKRLVKVEISQEKTRKDIEILTEVHRSYQEAHIREHKELMETIDNRTGVIELALRHNSKKLNKIANDMTFIRYRLFEDEKDIFSIKNRIGME
ncbi:hypothetical protein [Calorimonas adulescens]|uniref:Uncharacterized protein n=1 Tax=Calorimonas adulescens TaxID=2606906 RepID=A0A5D8QCV2_9THEO|nr:hypothetical protein [Calorimonas adulescens]TZE81168.1 hypothetical protein FWJ32_10550 [Calorimonas adulescens]